MPIPIPEPREAGFTTTTPVPLYWVRYGSRGAPPLVVLHGGPGADHRYLLPQLLHLAERHDVLLYDQRGGGQSRAGNSAPIGWRDHAADLASICREQAIPHPLLVGYSWGGLLAMLYAVEHARGADVPAPRALALISPAPITSDYRRQFDEALRRRGNAPAIVEARARLAASSLRDSDPAAYRQRIFELGVAGYFADPANAHDLTPFRVVGRVQQSTWESLGDFDLRPALRDVRLPVRIVHGRDDPIPAASSEDAARALGAGDGGLVLLDACGHVPYVEQPASLWAALDDFLLAHDVAAVS